MASQPFRLLFIFIILVLFFFLWEFCQKHLNHDKSLTDRQIEFNNAEHDHQVIYKLKHQK